LCPAGSWDSFLSCFLAYGHNLKVELSTLAATVQSSTFRLWI
jgi:hypothetical protein